jgi:dihydrofolate reductase
VVSKTSNALLRVLLAAVLLFNTVCSCSYSQDVVTPEQFTQDFDYLWSQLRGNYAYFDKKETDWGLGREVYRPRFAGIKTKREFITLLESVLEELYDHHTHLKINTSGSTRLVPTGLDVRAEWENGKAIITYLCGGAELAATLFTEGLVDEIILKLNPILLGSGIPLFSGAIKQSNLDLVDSKVYSSGVILLYYRVKR